MKHGFPGGDGPLRGALVGYGFIGGLGHVPAYCNRQKQKGDVEIVAVADICEARRSLVPESLPRARVYDDYRLLLEKEKNNLDFIDICTPPCDHAAVARAAFDSGLHVLCEKPLTTAVHDCLDLMDHAKRCKRVLYPCHNYKHAPVVAAMRDVIQGGVIGRVQNVGLSTFRHTHAKGVREWKTDWRRMRRFSGGGIAMDHGSHSFYLTFEWMGGWPISVSARMFVLDPTRYDTEDNFTAVLTFPRGIANVHLSWTAGVRRVMYTVQGDKGAMIVEDDDIHISKMRPGEGAVAGIGSTKWDTTRYSVSSEWMDASHTHWFNEVFEGFRSAILSGDHTGREAMDAYQCINVINAAYESAQLNGREVALDGWKAASMFEGRRYEAVL